jgi:DivIVA domain-containing protein
MGIARMTAQLLPSEAMQLTKARPWTIVTWLGVAIFVGGLWLNLRVEATPDGDEVPAKILAVHPSRLWIFDGAEVDVEYTVGNKDYRTTLTQSRLMVGDHFPKYLNVYVDRADPTRVGTIEGYISDGAQAWLARVPLILSVPIMAIGMALAPPRRRAPPPGAKGDELMNEEVRGEFDLVVWGYDRAQVNVFVQSAEWALSHVDDARRPQVLDEVRNPRFDAVLRGFDRQQVDRYVAQVQRDLGIIRDEATD